MLSLFLKMMFLLVQQLDIYHINQYAFQPITEGLGTHVVFVICWVVVLFIQSAMSNVDACRR